MTASCHPSSSSPKSDQRADIPNCEASFSNGSIWVAGTFCCVLRCSSGIASRSATWLGLWWTGQAAPASQLLGPSTHYPASSANAPASICEGVLHRHHVSSLHREGCDGEKKMDVCFLPYLICFAYICMLAIEPFALRIPFVSCRSFASQSWRVCMCVCVEGNPRF